MQSGASRLWLPAVGRPLAEHLVAEVLRVGPGASCLDLPCGSGGLAAALASAAGPDGRVIAVDPDAAARDACAEEVAGLSLRTVEVRASAPGGPPWADVAGSLLTLFHRDGPAALLAAAAGSLRPGGRLGVAAWEGGRPAEPLAAVLAALTATTGAPVAALEVALGADPLALARAAGLCGTQLLRLRDVTRFNGPQHLLAAIAGLHDLDVLVEALSDAALADVLDAVARRVRTYAVADGTLVIPVDLAVLTWVAPG